MTGTKLTREQILALSAGREMDRLVAELMGWRNIRDSDGYDHWTGDPPKGYEDDFSSAAHCEGELPFYSADIAAAMGVLCKARGDKAFVISGPIDNRPAEPYECMLVNKATGYGGTISHAICRAALLAALGTSQQT